MVKVVSHTSTKNIFLMYQNEHHKLDYSSNLLWYNFWKYRSNYKYEHISQHLFQNPKRAIQRQSS